MRNILTVNAIANDYHAEIKGGGRAIAVRSRRIGPLELPEMDNGPRPCTSPSAFPEMRNPIVPKRKFYDTKLEFPG